MSDAPRPSAPPPVAAYEFSEAHKDSFQALAASMSFVGVCVMLLGGMSAIFALGAVYAGFLREGLALVAGAAVFMAMGGWTMSAGRSLSALVRTHGRDIEQLLDAVGQLRRLFGFARVVIIVVALLVVVVAGGIVWCNFVVDKGGRCFGGLG